VVDVADTLEDGQGRQYCEQGEDDLQDDGGNRGG
jgi:hypothetical protein